MKDAYDLGYRLYFAYGGNLNAAQIGQRCQSPEVVAVARLADHRMGFFGETRRWDGGEETVLGAPGQDVWGVVYKLHFLDAEHLDAWQDVRLDGTGRYFHYPVLVHDAIGKAYPVLLYKKDLQGAACLPSTEYLQFILEGARARRLPEAYLQRLAALPSRAARFPVPRHGRTGQMLLADRCNACGAT